MNFRTEISIRQPSFVIDHTRHGFMAGSCFAENIYRKLFGAKFDVTANPTGILFNPMSIAGMLERLSRGELFTLDDLATDGELWFGWAHHGSFSGTDPHAVLEGMNRAALRGAEALAKADYVIITFGTAWTYRLVSTGEVVANCHRQHPSMFERHRLTVAGITEAYAGLLEGPLRDKQVIFTVSPVRHLKDGFEENSLSKAILRTAIGELTERYAGAAYFPAYEIVTDDLRDYRFYGEDMLHPTEQAVEYIWNKFTRWCMPAETRALLPRLDAVARAMGHRTMRPGTAADKAFRGRLLADIEALRKELPGVDFTPEESHFL